MNTAVTGWSVWTLLMEVIINTIRQEHNSLYNILTVTGNCLPVFGKKSGENCYQDADCETGYVCVDDTCSEPAPGVGKFGEFLE